MTEIAGGHGGKLHHFSWSCPKCGWWTKANVSRMVCRICGTDSTSFMVPAETADYPDITVTRMALSRYYLPPAQQVPDAVKHRWEDPAGVFMGTFCGLCGVLRSKQPFFRDREMCPKAEKKALDKAKNAPVARSHWHGLTIANTPCGCSGCESMGPHWCGGAAANDKH